MTKQDPRLEQLLSNLVSVLDSIKYCELDFDAAEFALKNAYQKCIASNDRFEESFEFELTHEFGVSNMLQERFKGCEFTDSPLSGKQTGKFVSVIFDDRMDFHSIRSELSSIGVVPSAQWIEAVHAAHAQGRLGRSCTHAISDRVSFVQGDRGSKYFLYVTPSGRLEKKTCSQSFGCKWHWLVQIAD